MIGNRSRDTRPEMALRKAVHRLGLRYIVAARPIKSIRRTADLVFTRQRVVVFLDGCFWHGCPVHFRMPHTHSEYWGAKIHGNQVRDRELDQQLREAGWTVIRVWAHENPLDAAARVREVVNSRHILIEDCRVRRVAAHRGWSANIGAT
jgi:DNA mismatch endonuclease, patch repair protein